MHLCTPLCLSQSSLLIIRLSLVVDFPAPLGYLAIAAGGNQSTARERRDTIIQFSEE